jgi:hypothetical protein
MDLKIFVPALLYKNTKALSENIPTPKKECYRETVNERNSCSEFLKTLKCQIIKTKKIIFTFCLFQEYCSGPYAVLELMVKLIEKT